MAYAFNSDLGDIVVIHLKIVFYDKLLFFTNITNLDITKRIFSNSIPKSV